MEGEMVIDENWRRSEERRFNGVDIRYYGSRHGTGRTPEP